MSVTDSSLLVKGQLPEFLKKDAGRFLDFMKEYYNFLQEYKIDLAAETDLDKTTEDYLLFYRNTLARGFPTPLIDERTFLKNVRHLYKKKGTVDAFILLFRLFFGEEIEVKEPSKNLLRASDGQWEQTAFITVKQEFIHPDFDPVTLVAQDHFILNTADGGQYSIIADEVINVDPGIYRIRFRPLAPLQFAIDFKVDIEDEFGEILFRGSIVPSPNKIKILSKGKNWTTGQVILIPGAKPTVARVIRTDRFGRLEEVEILEHGWGHQNNQTITVNPFPVKPTAVNFDISQVLTGVLSNGHPVYSYTVSVEDSFESFSEVVAGVSDAVGVDTYFSEDYVVSGYQGIQVISQRTTQGSSFNVDIPDPSLSVEEWFASNASLQYQFAPVTKERGQFVSSSGHLSNPDYKVQDSFFYQLFSYVIQSSQRNKDYGPIVDLIHPAGYKRFGEIIKNAGIDISERSSERTLSVERLYPDDNSLVSDFIAKTVVKPHQSFVSVTGGYFQDDYFSEDYSTPPNEFFRKVITKPFLELVPTESSISKNGTKQLNNDVGTTTEFFRELRRGNIQDEVETTEQNALVTSKILEEETTEDSVISLTISGINTTTNYDFARAGHREIAETSTIFYTESGYSEEEYSEPETLLKIG